MIDLRCCSFEAVIAERPKVCAVVADPPWAYNQATGNGVVAGRYGLLDNEGIAAHLDLTWDLVPDNAYLIVWCTWPKLVEWVTAAAGMRWRYVTGGAWTKSNGLGVGYHAAGDSEFALYYVKGTPRPAEGRQSNGWHAERQGHSEKPQEALDRLVRTVAPVGGVILDPYAGESASLARACLRLGRGYLGCEIDPERHAVAIRRLAGESAAQARMPGQVGMFEGEPITHGERV